VLSAVVEAKHESSPQPAVEQPTSPGRNLDVCDSGTRNGDVSRTKQSVEGAGPEQDAMIRDDQPATFRRPTLRHRREPTQPNVFVRRESSRHPGIMPRANR